MQPPGPRAPPARVLQRRLRRPRGVLRGDRCRGADRPLVRHPPHRRRHLRQPRPARQLGLQAGERSAGVHCCTAERPRTPWCAPAQAAGPRTSQPSPPALASLCSAAATSPGTIPALGSRPWGGRAPPAAPAPAARSRPAAVTAGTARASSPSPRAAPSTAATAASGTPAAGASTATAPSARTLGASASAATERRRARRRACLHGARLPHGRCHPVPMHHHPSLTGSPPRLHDHPLGFTPSALLIGSHS